MKRSTSWPAPAAPPATDRQRGENPTPRAAVNSQVREVDGQQGPERPLDRVDQAPSSPPAATCSVFSCDYLSWPLLGSAIGFLLKAFLPALLRGASCVLRLSRAPGARPRWRAA